MSLGIEGGEGRKEKFHSIGKRIYIYAENINFLNNFSMYVKILKHLFFFKYLFYFKTESFSKIYLTFFAAIFQVLCMKKRAFLSETLIF